MVSGNTSQKVVTSKKKKEEVLEYMKVTQLAANAEKTCFLMFGRNGEEPIQVGDTMIKELTEEKMLGVIITKDLGWKTHCEKLQSVV
jgi:hypothetical protein